MVTTTLDLKDEIRESHTIIGKGGEKIFAVLHRPINETKSLVVMICHGFASHKIGINRCYVTLAENLVKAGISCLRFDFRGCGDSEGILSQMMPADFVADISSVCSFLSGMGYEKFGLFGSSFGGSMSVIAADELKTFSSLVLWAPVASGLMWFQDYLAQNKSLTADPAKVVKVYKGVEITPEFQYHFGRMQAHETMKKIGNIPVLHFQGDEDETISLVHQHVFRESRKEATAKSQFITYPGIGHQFGASKLLLEVVTTIVDWFKTTL